jgi:hypothetical protein
MPIEGTISRFSEGTNTLLRCESLEPPVSQLGHSRRFKREVAREQPMKFLIACLSERQARQSHVTARLGKLGYELLKFGLRPSSGGSSAHVA